MASVIETFLILFKSNADDVEEGAGKASKATDDLEKSIKGADQGALRMGKSLNNLATQAVAAFGSVFAVTQLISQAKGIAEQSTQLGVLADVLGVNATEITNWGRAVESVGGDTSAFESSIRGLGQGLREAGITGPNSVTSALQLIGVNARGANGEIRTVLDLLPDLARELSRRPAADALAVGQMLGLDEGTILLLSRGEAEVAALVARQRELNLVSDEDRAILSALNLKWKEFGNLIHDVIAEITVFMATSSELRTFLKGLGIVVAGFALQAALLAAPFIAAAAAIAAGIFLLGMFVEDLEAYASGQDSMLGRAEKKWNAVANVMGIVRTTLQEIKRLFGEASTAADSFSVAGVVEEMRQGLIEFLNPGQLQLQTAGQFAIPSSPGAFMSAAMGITPFERTNTVSIEQIIINTQATDAKGIAAEVGPELQKQMQGAIDSFDDGVAG